MKFLSTFSIDFTRNLCDFIDSERDQLDLIAERLTTISPRRLGKDGTCVRIVS